MALDMSELRWSDVFRNRGVELFDEIPVSSIAEEFVCVEVNENTSMIGGRREVKGFISDGGDSGAELSTDEYIVNWLRSTDVSTWFVVHWELLFPDIN
jgi:hypothetical protein